MANPNFTLLQRPSKPGVSNQQPVNHRTLEIVTNALNIYIMIHHNIASYYIIRRLNTLSLIQYPKMLSDKKNYYQFHLLNKDIERKKFKLA